MSKHLQTLSEARAEARLNIPTNREWAYDFDKMEVEEETGALWPGNVVEYDKPVKMHSIEAAADNVVVLLSQGIPVTVVEAEKCTVVESGVHFVRIMYVSGYGPLSREFIWDRNH